jgi:ubiquinone/menaquinone biosynthesis C-methylase UbiE
MLIVNLGCGNKTSSHAHVVNVDWSLYLRLRRNWATRTVAKAVLNGERLAKFQALPENILVSNLAKGLPFDDGVVDVIYHSHFLEHLDRPTCPVFLKEVLRVLRPGGLHRIAVPDLELLARAYVESFDSAADDVAVRRSHDDHVAGLLEQSVRRVGAGTSTQSGVVRVIDRLVLGDARRRGETHQWMYDRINLPVLLEEAGFVDVNVASWNCSSCSTWQHYGLEIADDGSEYKPGSLYVEARKPVVSADTPRDDCPA